MQEVNVAHLTSVHPRFDPRIFLKECRSLSGAGYRVSLIVADGKGDEEEDGIRILDVGRAAGRLQRLTVTLRRIRRRALELDADIYHLHDPELLSIAGALRRAGKQVIFDAHEDVPVQILGKSYLHPWVRKFLSNAYELYAARVCRRLSAVVTATPFIRERFLPISPNSIDVNNFPLPDELASSDVGQTVERRHVCYVGGINVIRGIREIVSAMDMVESGARLILGGSFQEEGLRGELKACAGWDSVDERGWLGRDAIRDVLSESAAGLVTLHPQPNYLDAHPVKMFEYMSAGVPVISSNFPLWRSIVEGNDCGLCVDPKQPKEIAEAIDYLVRNPSRAREMGENGRKAVKAKYNWPAEERKLVELYDRLSDTTDEIQNVQNA